MNIGVDARELQGRPTGTGRYLRNLLARLPRPGEDRLFAYFDGPAPADPVLAAPAIESRAVGPGGVRGLVWQERLLPAAIRADRLDVLFCPAYTCPLSIRLPRATTVHDLSFFDLPWDFTPLDGIRRRLTVGASIRASRRILAVSDFTRRRIRDRFPEAAERVLHVDHGADDDLPAGPSREEARARLRIQGPLVLAVGSILNRRHLPDLLQAVARLRRLWPDLVLEVVGDNRTHPRLDLRARLAGLGLTRRVRLSGFLPEADLALRYAAADVVVCLSEYEGFGLPGLEAASRGVPLVAARRPALDEIFGEAALLVEPDDPVDVARSLQLLLSSPRLRQQLVARGRALAARLTWAEAARRTRDALEAACRP